MKNIGLIILILAIIGSIVVLEIKKPKQVEVDKSQTVVNSINQNTEKSSKYDQAIEISTPDAFINTESISINELVGEKVILIDFWTYSCINCQRTTPYLNDWYEKYSDQGLEIIGIHTPEFEFEKVLANVQSAVADMGIKFPVVMDNDYSTWRSYKNRFWPRKYLIDIDGYIVYDHIGEGAYAETEAIIQKLLKERAEKLKLDIAINNEITDGKMQTAVTADKTPEIYLGANRNSKFIDNASASTTGEVDLELPNTVTTHKFALEGNWSILDEYISTLKAGAKLALNFNAKQVFMVASGKEKTRVVVTLDGKALNDTNAGGDIQFENGESVIYYDEEKLYKILNSKQTTNGILEFKADSAGLNVFTFTFG